MTVYVADMGSQNPVNFSKLAAAGCAGVILRATRSNEQDDVAYPARHAIVRAAGMLCGAYAFNTGEPPLDQVARFLGWAQLADDEAGYLDLERNPSGTGQMSLTMTIEWLDRYDQKMGRYCGLYSGDVIKTLITHASSVQRDFLAAHPLWGCEYGPHWRNVDANGHALPWTKPFLWQCTGDGIGPEPRTLDGLEPGADLSVYDGTAEQLRAVWALPAIVPAGAAA